MDVVNSSINALNALAGKIAPADTSAGQTPVETKATSVRDHPYGNRGVSKKTGNDDGDTNLVATLKQAVAAQQQAVALQQQQQQHQAAVAAAVLQQQSAAAAMVSACSTTSPSIIQANSCNGNDESSTILRNAANSLVPMMSIGNVTNVHADNENLAPGQLDISIVPTTTSTDVNGEVIPTSASSVPLNGTASNIENTNNQMTLINGPHNSNGIAQSLVPSSQVSEVVNHNVPTVTMNGNSPLLSVNSVSSGGDQPDQDTIKMFVGQVPRSMDENDLRGMFEEFGPVYQINVLRDKITGQSKGCCFVTFYTRKAALEAQNALHNIKTLPGMHHPIQMKPADTENRNERKLFVGMVSKKYSESDVRVMFNSFGTIEECTVLRDTNGVSKGCAFVTFSTRQCAITAIKAMHHSQTMEGCSSPMVVKFADTQKEKEQKKVQQLQTNLWNLSGINPNTAVIATGNPQYLAAIQQVQALNGLQATGTSINQVTPTLSSIMSSAPSIITTIASPHPNSAVSPSSVTAFQGAGLTGSASSNTNTAATSLAAMAGLSNTSGVNMLALQHLFAGSPLTTGLPASGLTNSVSVPSLVTNSFHTQQTQESHQQPQQPQNQQVVTGLNGGSYAGCGISPAAANSNPNAGINSVALQYQNNNHRTISVPGMDQPTEQQLQSVHSSTSSFPNYTGLTIPNQNFTIHNHPQHVMGGVSNLSAVALAHQLSATAGTNFSGGLQSYQKMYQEAVSGNNPLTGIPTTQAYQLLSTANPCTTSIASQIGVPSNCATTQQYSTQNSSGAIQAAVAAANAANVAAAAAANGSGLTGLKQHEGPDGANLFIYHLPQEYTDSDLLQTFNPFGNVISAKVFIDKITNLSKCFGFVSYDNPVSAHAAIQAMNGFQVGTKRLKVQLKRCREKPY